MTHKQTWLTIAEAYATPPVKRTDKQTRITFYGLCGAAWFFRSGMSSWEIVTLEDMVQKLCSLAPLRYYSAFDKEGLCYWWPISNSPGHTREHDFLRCIFAGLLAAMSKKEFEQLLESPQ